MANETKPIEYKTTKDEDGSDCIIARMNGYIAGKYQIMVEPVKNKVGVKGKTQISIIKYNLDDQRAAATASEAQAQQASTGAKAGFSIAIILNVFFNLVLKNLSSDGFLLKFSMIIKLINRLRFINVQYGMALSIFMELVGDITALSTSKDRDYIDYHTKKKAGKFFEFLVDIEVWKPMSFIIVLYIFFFITKVPIDYWLKRMRLRPKNRQIWMYAIINFHGKFHLMFFTMALMDITFYGARNILHITFNRITNGLIANYILACITTLMIGYDMARMGDYYLRMKFSKEIRQFHANVYAQKLTPEQFEAEKRRKHANVKIQNFYMIDHQATVKALITNYHILGFIIGDFQKVDERINGVVFKLASFLFIFRFPIYQLALVALQSSPMGCVSVCLVLELSALILNIRVLFIMTECWTVIKISNKIAQSAGISIFLTICLYLAYIGNETSAGIPVSLSIQKVTIVFIIITVGIEYIFGMLSMVLVAQNLIRNRYISQETRIAGGYDYIKYKEHDIVKDIEQGLSEDDRTEGKKKEDRVIRTTTFHEEVGPTPNKIQLVKKQSNPGVANRIRCILNNETDIDRETQDKL